MSALTYKFEIIKPLNMTWDKLGEVLRQADYYAFRIMNDAVSMYHEHVRKALAYKDETGEKFSVLENYGVKTYETIISRELKEKYANELAPGGQLEGVIRNAIARYKTFQKDILRGNASVPSFRRGQPVPFRGRGVKIADDLTLKIGGFISKEKAQQLGFSGLGAQALQLAVSTKKAHQKALLKDALAGKVKVCDSSIQAGKNGKWFVNLVLNREEKTAEENGLDVNRILGIDLGIANAAVLAVSDSPKNLFINGGEIEAFRRRIEGRRKSMRNQLKVCSDNRRGHGRKTLLAPLDVISHKIENFKNLTNHRYARKIVDYAIKNGCGTIQMEDLTGINGNSVFLKTWSYYDLQTKVAYKAKEAGIRFVKIKPKYTSQRCNHCGVIDANNRPTQATFKCTTCGTETHADLNAARNIAMADIDKIITQQLKAA